MVHVGDDRNIAQVHCPAFREVLRDRLAGYGAKGQTYNSAFPACDA
ncbi:hypothetical protein Ga0080574_TMP4136 [Salipiger abyssi]|uniref:Uncharacterized protein n=1 Tax=Salipiger abyssi TaxID=1250539 RepID=A0A1P8UYK4_9RHOB|nr:hypothetical protein Ga0080574_TMP4136 [Salipiger abyssi]